MRNSCLQSRVSCSVCLLLLYFSRFLLLSITLWLIKMYNQNDAQPAGTTVNILNSRYRHGCRENARRHRPSQPANLVNICCNPKSNNSFLSSAGYKLVKHCTIFNSFDRLLDLIFKRCDTNCFILDHSIYIYCAQITVLKVPSVRKCAVVRTWADNGS